MGLFPEAMQKGFGPRTSFSNELNPAAAGAGANRYTEVQMVYNSHLAHETLELLFTI